jgi:hypothetical protein
MRKIRDAAEDIAQQVNATFQGLDEHLAADQAVYVFALVVSDDFGQLMGYANSEAHFAKSERIPLDRWYVAQWFATGMDLECEVLRERIGDATDDEAPIQAAWLLAMTEGLKLVRDHGGMMFRGRPVIAYCSMIDSANALWIERETARAINPPEAYAAIAAEMSAASVEWYGEGEREPSDLQIAFDQLCRKFSAS